MTDVEKEITRRLVEVDPAKGETPARIQVLRTKLADAIANQGLSA